VDYKKGDNVMADLLVIKRNWNSTIIRVEVKRGELVEIDIPIDSFEKILCNKVIELLPSLALSFKADTINKTVSDTVSKAFSEVTQQLKVETIRVA